MNIKELTKVLARIALQEHAEGCPNQLAPIDICTCFQPDKWASEALGFKPAHSRSDKEEAKLRSLLS